MQTSVFSFWVYLRKSRALGDPDDPHLLEAHRKELTRLLQQDGHDPESARFEEEIGSAEHIEERAVFARLLREWERLPAGVGGVVYVTEVARLSRGSQSEWGRIEEALRRACIRIRTRRRLFDLNDLDDANWLEWEILYSRFELRMNKIRMASWRATQLREGRIRTGRVPGLGYTWDRNTMQPVPNDRFPLLQRLCREALTQSVHELAARHGINEGTLLLTLTNPMICGWPAQRHRSYVPEKGWRKPGWRLPREEWVWPEKPGTYPPACTRAEWEALQEAIRQRAIHRERPGSDAGWCRDVVQFVGSPGRAHLGSVRPPGKPGYPSYDLTPPQGRRLYIDRAPVHEAAALALRSLIQDPAWLTRAFRLYEERQQEREAVVSVDQGQLRRSLERERARLANINRARFDPDLTAEAGLSFAHAARDTEALIERLKADLQQAQLPPALDVDLSEIWELLPDLCQEWDSLWADREAFPDSRRRLVARGCLAAVPVLIDPDRSQRPIYREVLPARYHDWIEGVVG